MTNAIEIKNFSKQFSDFTIENMNLSVRSGYITGFIGKNGAGKTTTIKAILNLLNYDGEIKVLGEQANQKNYSTRDRIGVVLSDDGFPEDLKIKALKSIIAPSYSMWDEDAFQSYMSDFELSTEQKVKELSRGMRVKLSLAFALSHNAQLYIMDEPTAGLDPMVRAEILDIFMELMQDEKKSVFFSTHITSDLDKIADYIVMINDGKIILDLSKDELLESHRIIKGPETAFLNVKAKLIGFTRSSFGFEGLIKTIDAPSIKDGLLIEKPNIEQLMIHYIKEDKSHD